MEEDIVEPILNSSNIQFIAPFGVVVLIATLCVDLGSRLSISLPNDIQAETSVSIDKKEGLKMPVMATVSLLALYFAHKFFNAVVFKSILYVYFIMAVTSSFYGIVYWFIRGRLPKKLTEKQVFFFNSETHPKLDSFLKHTIIISKIHIDLNAGSLLATVVSAILPVIYTIMYWEKENSGILVSDLLAMSIAITVIPSMKITKWVYGVVVLLGLMLYDILWVFGIRLKSSEGSSVMEVVARNIKLPLKIIVPRTIKSVFATDSSTVSRPLMLGLGDIVIPGAFLAMCKQMGADILLPNGKQFHQVYRVGLVFYVLALAVTGISLFVTKQGQPALLFISPMLVVSTLLAAVVYRRTEAVFGWKVQEPEAACAEDKKGRGSSSDS